MQRATIESSKVCPTCGARYATDALFCPNDGTPLSTALPAGESGQGDVPDPYLGREISGHIEVRQLAGIGAMGRVYRAFQRGIERDVAVKVLHRELSANAQLVTRFHREAKVASRLSHPNVVQVHLAGQLPDGALYIVMEYLDGMSLQSALAAAGGAIPLPRALHIALQICDAAGEAHAQGIVHRDLKPENVMLVRRGDDADYVKVLDFGIARLNWGEQSMATAAGLIFGTARYISPEGAQGEAVGPGGDVYAIATLLYQMLSGRTPFEGDQAVALLVQQIHDSPAPIKSIARAAYLPDPIALLIMRNLAKHPDARARDARALGRLLVDAVKASGLSPEDLVNRSMLLGSKGAMQLPPVQRTRQLQLEPDVAERLAGVPARLPRSDAPGAKTVMESAKRQDPGFGPAGAGPAPRQGSLAAAPPPVSTTKWVPPIGFAERLETSAAANEFAPVAVSRAPAFPPPRQSGVDATLDDELPPARPPIASAPRVRTEFAEPPDVEAGAFKPTLESTIAQPPRSRPGGVAPASEGRPGGVLASDAHSRPISTVETTLSDEEAAILHRRSRTRAGVFVLLCFFLGAAIAATVLFRMGVIGPNAGLGTLDDQVLRAEDALKRKRWDAPPGDNVRDLTNDGLAKWHNDPRLLDTRARATDELVKEAVGRRFAGDLPEALHLARLANELDPSDTTAQHLLEEVQQASKPGEPVAPVPPLEAGLAPAHSATSKVTVPTGPSTRVTLEATPLRPHLGQPVAFVAKITTASGSPPKAIEDVHFQLSGPGLAPDTRLSAMADAPGVYRTAFTFFETGKFDVTFDARVDGVLIRTVRAVVAGDEVPPPQGPPPPTPSGKWL